MYKSLILYKDNYSFERYLSLYTILAGWKKAITKIISAKNQEGRKTTFMADLTLSGGNGHPSSLAIIQALLRPALGLSKGVVS